MIRRRGYSAQQAYLTAPSVRVPAKVVNLRKPALGSYQ